MGRYEKNLICISLILMKTLEIKKKNTENKKKKGVLTKLIISQLLRAVEYQTLYQFNVQKKKTFYQVV